MTHKAKKMAVFQRVSEESAIFTLKSLLASLGDGYSQRTVRRWLGEMIREGVLDKYGQKRGTEYQFRRFPKMALQERLIEQPISEESKKILEKVRGSLFLRKPVPYVDEWVEAYKPNQTFYLSSQIRAKLHQAGKRFQMRAPAGTYAHQIFNRLLIDLSYNSSRLEGNTYSLSDTQKLLLEGKIPKGKLREETVMLLNHQEAIRFLVDAAPRLKVNSETVCQLHYLLSEELLESQYMGKIRDHGVRISGSSYIPFENPRDLHIRLNRILNQAALIEDPYEQSLFLLIHISYLQAFSDVNKRTARLSANIPLIKHNLVPISFNEVERDDYNSALIAIYELQEVGPLAELYAFSYIRTCIMYDSTVKMVGVDEIRVFYRFQRREMVREIVLKHLKGSEMEAYIRSKAAQVVEPEDQKAFFEDAMEDVNRLDTVRLAGLGITPEEFHLWRQA